MGLRKGKKDLTHTKALRTQRKAKRKRLTCYVKESEGTMYYAIAVFVIGAIFSGFIYKKTGSAIATVACSFAFFLVVVIGFVVITAKLQSMKKAQSLVIAQAAGFSSTREYNRAKRAGFNTKQKYEAHKKEERRLAEIKRADDLVECRKDLTCWAERRVVSASYLCKPQIERQAKYSFKWTDGILGSKLTRYRWKNRANGVVTYIGDKIQFQNGFGVWQNCIYECDYDPENDVVLAVRVNPGRLE